MANGYEELSPAEQAAAEAQEKGLTFAQPPSEIGDDVSGAYGTKPEGLTAEMIEGGFNVPYGGYSGDFYGDPGIGTGGFAGPPIGRYAGNPADISGGWIYGMGDPQVEPQPPQQSGQPRNLYQEQLPNGAQNGGVNGAPTLPTTPTTPQPGAMGQGFGGIPSGQNIMGAGNQGYTGGQGFVPSGNGTVTDGGTITDGGTAATNGAITGQLDKFSVGQSFDTGYGAYDLTPEDVSALNSGMITPDQLIQNIIGRVEHKEPLPSAPTDIGMSSEQDLTDEDFRNVWDRVNSNAIPMAQLGNFLKFETTDVVVGTDANGDPITARETRMSTRSRELLNRAIAVEAENRIEEQENFERDIEKARITGTLKGTETLENRKLKLQEKLAKAEATGMFGEEATLAKQRLDLEEKIDFADRTGEYFDPQTQEYKKTLSLKKMEMDKELADAERQMQETALMGANPEGVVTFAKEQWLDQIETDKARYNDAFVYDENGNLETDAQGNPILQTLAARQLTEDVLQRNADRGEVARKTKELERSNKEAERIRLIELGYDKETATTLADRQLTEKKRASEAAEDLRQAEIDLEVEIRKGQLSLDKDALSANIAQAAAGNALAQANLDEQIRASGVAETMAQDEFAELKRRAETGEQLAQDELNERIRASGAREEIQIREIDEKIRAAQAGEEIAVAELDERIRASGVAETMRETEFEELKRRALA